MKQPRLPIAWSTPARREIDGSGLHSLPKRSTRLAALAAARRARGR